MATVPMKPTFVLLGGPRCSGKNYVADKLTAATGWAQASFADAVKEEAALKHGLDVARLKSTAAADRPYKEEHRAKLIELGNGRRAEDPMYWARRVFDTHCTPGAVYVLCDYRFPNEEKFLRECGANVLTVRVSASDETRRARGWTPNPAVDNDISETALNDTIFDVIMPNDAHDVPELILIIANAERIRARRFYLEYSGTLTAAGADDARVDNRVAGPLPLVEEPSQ